MTDLHAEEDRTTTSKPAESRPRRIRTEGLGTAGILPGAAVGFCGTFTYVLSSIIWQLGVDNSSRVSAVLLPHPADWVTSVLTLTAYGLPSSAVLGGLAGLITGWLIGRSTRSSSAALAWVFGTVTAFVLIIAVRVVLTGVGLHADFGRSTRLFTVPMIIFLVEGGVLGVWTQRRQTELIDSVGPVSSGQPAEQN